MATGIKTPEEAETSAKAARTAMPEQRSKNKSPVRKPHHWHRYGKTAPIGAESPVRETPTTSPVSGNRTTIYISGGYAAAASWMQHAHMVARLTERASTPRPRRVGTKPDLRRALTLLV